MTVRRVDTAISHSETFFCLRKKDLGERIADGILDRKIATTLFVYGTYFHQPERTRFGI